MNGIVRYIHSGIAIHIHEECGIDFEELREMVRWIAKREVMNMTDTNQVKVVVESCNSTGGVPFIQTLHHQMHLLGIRLTDVTIPVPLIATALASMPTTLRLHAAICSSMQPLPPFWLLLDTEKQSL